MLPRFAKLAIAITLASSIGLHWAFLQSLAWVGMVVSYSQDAPLKEALEKTFDGKHPCALCKEIAKGKQSEKKSESPLQPKKLDFLSARMQFIFTAPSQFWCLLAPDEHPVSVFLTPPTPPPRGVFV